MEEKAEKFKLRLHLIMSLIGGWTGTYCVLRFHHFASAATMNSVDSLTSAAVGNWQGALVKFCAVAVYAVGLFLASILPLRAKSDLRAWAICLDGAAAVLMCTVPDGQEYGIFFSLFAMAFQWSVFSGPRGYPCSTIFCSNNLRQFLDAWVQVHYNGDALQIPRMRLYGWTLLAFYTGVAAVCVLWYLGFRRWSILAVLLAAALGLDCLRREAAECVQS